MEQAPATVTIKNVMLGDVVRIAQSPYSSLTCPPDDMLPFPDDPYVHFLKTSWSEIWPKQWSYYRLVKLFRLPGGDIGMTHTLSIDHYGDHHRESPFYVSKDEGASWTREEPPHPAFRTMTPMVSYVGNNEYFFIPIGKGFCFDDPHSFLRDENNIWRYPAVKKFPMPKAFYPIGSDGLDFKYYKLDECHPDIQAWYKDVKGLRWTQDTGWELEDVGYPHENQVIFAYEDKFQNYPGEWGNKVWSENRIARSLDGHEIYYGDYWSQYLEKDGNIPPTTRTYLMASTDRGRTWRKRGTIAHDSQPLAEPMVEVNECGDLICVMRGNDSMYISYSYNNGDVWTPPVQFMEYGVMPQLLRLDCGVMVLLYSIQGDPNKYAVKLSFSTDGGYNFSPAQTISRPGVGLAPCGYSSLLALGANSFLAGYPGNGDYGNSPGDYRKQLLVRKIIVETE